MLDFLPAPLKGILAVLLILINTLLFLPLLLLVALAKLVVPVQPFRKACTIVLNAIAWYWIGFNNTLMNLLHRVEWEVRGAEELSKEHWYFVTCNHQSWADIPAILYVLNSKIPLLKFFLKKQLIWVPLLGVAWWALDFPFMHRHTKEQIAKRPELKGKDIEATKAACEKFRYTPVTIFNFMEGTRFTPEKHQRQNSPYKHLLKPRAGGTAFVFGAMGEMIHTMLDVTIVYPGGRPGIWDYLCGRVRKIVIDIRTREVPERFLGMDYENNREVRVDFQRWVSEIWAEKDQRIETLLAENS
ncbi:acyltransferase [Marinobacter nauticus]|uniref:Phospholipid/glycerol acyltransferase n=1 Tax=Marinobacter nauticus (strain ATCC 700491 / DSM 11845 / VT8) TaxID=351348 RepID=A1U448_MARN8|nr:acyltransferase [Marinobacter nauticus]ABM19767.1 phospholipid/glycerol acyltransferase [Marinobacter nauticus VT8]